MRILANRRRESRVISAECKLTGDVDNSLPKVAMGFRENKKQILQENVKDIKNVKMKKKLIKVLQSSDFFDSENYPKTKFTFEEVKITNEGTYLIGQMRIKGKVVKEEIKLESIDNNSASGKFSINRSKYDIYPGFFMNLVIDKQFDIDFKIIIK